MNIKNSHIGKIENIKKSILTIAKNSHVGHIPSSFSSVEILYVLYAKIANITKDNAADLERNRVILSKEHARLGQVAVLSELDLLDKNLALLFMADNDAPLGHDMYNYVYQGIDAVDIGCGSLGHGLPFAVGLAWDSDAQIYVLVGDGELQEGTNWESIMFAGFNKMNNLTLIIDRNNQQIDNFTQNIVDSSTHVIEQISSFGFEVFEVDGHDIDALEKVLKIETSGAKCIVANTIKGKECFFAIEEMGFGCYHAAEFSEQNLHKANLRIEECQ